MDAWVRSPTEVQIDPSWYLGKTVKTDFFYRGGGTIYPWAVYCEGPPSFIWGEEGEPTRGALLFQSTNDIHIQNTAVKHTTNKNTYILNRTYRTHRKKIQKSAEQIQIIGFDKRIATSERKNKGKQGKTVNFTVFRRLNFIGIVNTTVCRSNRW